MSDADTAGTESGDGTELGAYGRKPPPEPVDWEAEAKKWQAAAAEEKKLKRKVEDQNKKNMTDLEKLQQAALTDQEKAVAAAVAAARDEARQETLRSVGHRLVDAEVKTLAQGRGVNVDALLEGLDRTRFLGDDLEPDVPGIAAWVESLTPKRDGAGFDIGQGARGNGAGGADLANMDEFTRMLLNKAGGARK